MLEFGFYNMDCMEGMKEFPDKYFDLAIVDPPYGGGSDDYTAQTQRYGGWFSRYFDKEKQKELKAERRGGQWASKYGNNICEWDVAPTEEYFEELFRISKNQIIWGGTTSDFRRQGALSYGVSRKSLNDSRCQCASTLGQVSTVTQKCSNIHHSEVKKNVFTQRKSQSLCIDGYLRTMRNRATNYSIRTSEAGRR